MDESFVAKTNSGFAWNRTFTGLVLDAETGLILYRNRYYHTGLGRFVSRDPIWYDSEDFNLYRYRYCLNNPLKYIDQQGELVWKPVVIVIIIVRVRVVGGEIIKVIKKIITKQKSKKPNKPPNKPNKPGRDKDGDAGCETKKGCFSYLDNGCRRYCRPLAVTMDSGQLAGASCKMCNPRFAECNRCCLDVFRTDPGKTHACTGMCVP